MFRALAIVASLLVALPVAAGPAWMCLCTAERGMPCCPEPADEHSPGTVQKACCCGVDVSAPSPAPDHVATVEKLESFALDHLFITPVTVRVDGPAPPQLATLPATNTGPPGDVLVLLQSVRLRP